MTLRERMKEVVASEVTARGSVPGAAKALGVKTAYVKKLLREAGRPTRFAMLHAVAEGNAPR